MRFKAGINLEMETKTKENKIYNAKHSKINYTILEFSKIIRYNIKKNID